MFMNPMFYPIPRQNAEGQLPNLPMTPVPGVQGLYTMPAGTQLPAQFPGMVTQPYPPLMPGTPASTIAPTVMEPVDIGFEEGPPTLTNIGYIPAFLRTIIGRHVRCQFLIGTNSFLDKSGTLVAVGISYLILRDETTRQLILCDMYSLKFVEISPIPPMQAGISPAMQITMQAPMQMPMQPPMQMPGFMQIEE